MRIQGTKLQDCGASVLYSHGPMSLAVDFCGQSMALPGLRRWRLPWSGVVVVASGTDILGLIVCVGVLMTLRTIVGTEDLYKQ